MRRPICFVVCVVAFLNFASAQMLEAEHTWITGNGYPLKVTVNVSINDNLVALEMTGPTDTWFAYGFGNYAMEGAYAIVSEEDGGAVINERRLGDHNRGSVLPNGIISREITDDGDVRTILLEFALRSDTTNYDFPMADSIINYITATGFEGQGVLNYHGPDNHAESTLVASSGIAFTSVVPVMWSAFDVSEKEGLALLTWETSSETNNDGFYVQRSLDAVTWKDLDYLAGVGDLGGNYKFMDRHMPPGVIYYRIKQVDHDGSLAYSTVKSIEITGSDFAADLKLFPNPVGDLLSLEMPAVEGNARIQVVNMQMQTVIDEMWSEDSGNHQMDVSKLLKGHYFLTVKHKRWSYSDHFIKL